MRFRRLVLVVGLFFASTVVASCGWNRECSRSLAPGSFVGRLIAINGQDATFSVESWTPTPGVQLHAPAPVAGSSAVVRYSSSEIKYLHVGRSYSVMVFDDDHGLGSSVHHADDACSGGTVYANGKSIDTSVWSRTIVRRAIAGFIVFLVALLTFLAWITRRSRLRRMSETVPSERAR